MATALSPRCSAFSQLPTTGLGKQQRMVQKLPVIQRMKGLSFSASSCVSLSNFDFKKRKHEIMVSSQNCNLKRTQLCRFLSRMEPGSRSRCRLCHHGVQLYHQRVSTRVRIGNAFPPPRQEPVSISLASLPLAGEGDAC